MDFEAVNPPVEPALGAAWFSSVARSWRWRKGAAGPRGLGVLLSNAVDT